MVPGLCDRFSGVFAEKASGEVFLVSQWSGEIDECRVWKRIELPTLVLNPNVQSITLVDFNNFANQKVYWSRQTSRDSADDFLAKRDLACLDWLTGDGDDLADA